MTRAEAHVRGRQQIAIDEGENRGAYKLSHAAVHHCQMTRATEFTGSFISTPIPNESPILVIDSH